MSLVKCMESTFNVLAEVARERVRQDAKWGPQNHPDWTPTGPTSDLSKLFPGGAANHFRWITDAKARGFEGLRLGYFDVLMEEVAESHDEAKAGDEEALRAELVQVAAVAVAWIESIDRRNARAVDSVSMDPPPASGAIAWTDGGLGRLAADLGVPA